MHKIYQIYTALVCSFGSLVMGLLNVWPSYTLSLYQAQNTTLLTEPMSELEASLVGSLPSLGAIAGTAGIGPLINIFGRKKGGVIMSLPYVISWVMIQYTKSTMVILIARFLGGFPGGASVVYASVFISEVSEPSIRGGLAAGPLAFYSLGVLFSYILGWFVSYENIIRINLVASVVAVISCITVKESPFFLLKKNDEEGAIEAIAHYRGTSPTSKVVLEELSRIKQQLNPAVQLVAVNDGSDKKPEEAEKEKLNPEPTTAIPEEEQKISSYKLLFKSASSRRAFLAVYTLMTLQVFMGLVPVQVYAQDLFEKAAADLSSDLCSVLFACVIVVGCMVPVFIADMTGRRVLIISSSILVAICMFTLGVLQQTKLGPAWVSAIIILVYCFAFNYGAGSVPYILLTEVFIPEVQNLASMILVEWIWFTNFVIIGIYPVLNKYLGFHNVCYMFAMVGVGQAVACYFMVPETKGLTLTQIQEAFLKRRRQ